MTPSYADITDLDKYGLPSAALSTFSDSEKQDSLDGASAIADSYLGSRFDLPLSSWGLDLRMHVAKIAVFFLITRRGFNPSAGSNDEGMKVAHDDAIKWLKDVVAGKATPVNVVDASGEPENTTGSSPLDMPYVQQLSGGVDSIPESDLDFWGTSSSNTSTVGAPKTRGW